MEISNAVQAYLDSNKNKTSDTPKERKFYLSDMTKCMRVRFLKRKGIEATFAPHVTWIFQIGDLYHDFVYKALESQGRLLASEDYIKTEHFVGRYDGKVKDSEGKAIIDIKSAPAYKMARIIKGEDDEQYIAQVLSYQMLLMEQGEKDLVKSILLFVNKEPSERSPVCFFEKHYMLTSWRKKQLKEEMDKLTDFWLKNKIPPCTCPGWMKPYNAYLPFCQMAEKDIKKYLDYLKADKKLITNNHSVTLIDKEKKKVLIEI